MGFPAAHLPPRFHIFLVGTAASCNHTQTPLHAFARPLVTFQHVAWCPCCWAQGFALQSVMATDGTLRNRAARCEPLLSPMLLSGTKPQCFLQDERQGKMLSRLRVMRKHSASTEKLLSRQARHMPVFELATAVCCRCSPLAHT